MNVRFWKNFSKKSNSTKQPPSTAGSYTDKTVYLKDSTSIESPTFLIDAADLDWNYCGSTIQTGSPSSE